MILPNLKPHVFTAKTRNKTGKHHRKYTYSTKTLSDLLSRSCDLIRHDVQRGELRMSDIVSVSWYIQKHYHPL